MGIAECICFALLTAFASALAFLAFAWANALALLTLLCAAAASFPFAASNADAGMPDPFWGTKNALAAFFTTTCGGKDSQCQEDWQIFGICLAPQYSWSLCLRFGTRVCVDKNISLDN